VVTIALVGWLAGLTALLVCAATTGWNAMWCMRRIQGITGDTLGASVELCEALVLVAGSIIGLL